METPSEDVHWFVEASSCNRLVSSSANTIWDSVRSAEVRDSALVKIRKRFIMEEDNAMVVRFGRSRDVQPRHRLSDSRSARSLQADLGFGISDFGLNLQRQSRFINVTKFKMTKATSPKNKNQANEARSNPYCKRVAKRELDLAYSHSQHNDA